MKITLFSIVILLSLCTCIAEASLYVQFLPVSSVEHPDPEIRLILNKGELISINHEKMFIGIMQKNGLIVPVDNFHFNIDLKTTEHLEGVDELVLKVISKEKERPFTHLKIHEYGYLVINNEMIDVNIAVEILDSRIQINDIDLEYRVEFPQYLQYKEKLGNPVLEYHSGTTMKSIPLTEHQGYFFVLDDYLPGIDYYLSGSYYQKKLDLTDQRINIKDIDLQIDLFDPEQKIRDLSVYALDEEGNEYEIAGSLPAEVDEISMLDLGYHDLRFRYRMQDKLKETTGQILIDPEQNKYVLQSAKTAPNVLLIPPNYQEQKFNLEIYFSGKRNTTSIPVNKQSELVLPGNHKVSDIRLINYSSSDEKIRKRVLISNENELNIYDKTDLVVLDFNPTSFALNKKKNEDFLNFLNNLIIESQTRNLLIMKYFTVIPKSAVDFANYNVPEIYLNKNGFKDYQKFSSSIINEDNINNFLEFNRSNTITLDTSDVLQLYYACSPVLEGNFTSYNIPSSIVKEESLASLYWKYVKQNIIMTLSKSGFEFSRLIYITYNEIDFSLSKDKDLENDFQMLYFRDHSDILIKQILGR